jgi:hypothetical protein
MGQQQQLLFHLMVLRLPRSTSCHLRCLLLLLLQLQSCLQQQEQQTGSWLQTLRLTVLQHQQDPVAAAAAAAVYWAVPVQHLLHLAQGRYCLLLLVLPMLLRVRLVQHLLLLHQQDSKP